MYKPQDSYVEGLVQAKVLVNKHSVDCSQSPLVNFLWINVAHLQLRDDPNHSYDVDRVVRDKVMAVLTQLAHQIICCHAKTMSCA